MFVSIIIVSKEYSIGIIGVICWVEYWPVAICWQEFHLCEVCFHVPFDLHPNLYNIIYEKLFTSPAIPVTAVGMCCHPRDSGIVTDLMGYFTSYNALMHFYAPTCNRATVTQQKQIFLHRHSSHSRYMYTATSLYNKHHGSLTPTILTPLYSMIQMKIFGKFEGKRKGAKSLKLERWYPQNLVHIHILSTSTCKNETLVHGLATSKIKVYGKHFLTIIILWNSHYFNVL